MLMKLQCIQNDSKRLKRTSSLPNQRSIGFSVPFCHSGPSTSIRLKVGDNVCFGNVKKCFLLPFVQFENGGPGPIAGKGDKLLEIGYFCEHSESDRNLIFRQRLHDEVYIRQTGQLLDSLAG